MYSIDEIFGQDGLLSQQLSNFAPRQQQIDMAYAVTKCLQENNATVIEAGTGTGKTLSYLVPAMLSGMKIIISTGTKNLQEQIFNRDLPLVRKSLGVPMKAVMLKGRANYVCLYRVEHVAPYQLKFSEQFERELEMVKDWTGYTRTGDVAELKDIKEGSGIWSNVTSTVDNCLGQDCPSFNECFMFKQRREAQKADILVVNHHLFFADMALKDDGYGELLPGAAGVIFDEAHQIPGISARFFSKNLTSNQLSGLISDISSEQKEHAHDHIELADCVDDFKVYLAGLVAAVEKLPPRSEWYVLANNLKVDKAMNTLMQGFAALQAELDIAAPRSKGLETCRSRAAELSSQLNAHMEDDIENYVHWYEQHKRGFIFSLTPLHMSEIFRNYIQSNKMSWIFTSATLSVGEKFDFYLSELGLEDANQEKFDSPFDYRKQVLLYLPENMPEPNSQFYTDTVIEMLLPVVRASRGRAFLLFTSHAALNQAYQYLKGKLEYPLLVQGSMPKSELLKQFEESGNAVLIGTSSFWEGVDVRGEALSCVVIDKLPFASPGDPILKARMEAIRNEGRNPFMDYQLPQAVISLKQGFGRLIRDVSDRGVIMICDPRLKTKAYGKIFLKSLPQTNITVNVDDVEEFFLQDSGSE